jgi:hypothetical protein
MNDKLDKPWREAVVAYFNVLSHHLPEGLKKPTTALNDDNRIKDEI